MWCAESTSIAARVTGADSVLFYLYEEEGQRHHVRAGLPGDERWVDVHSFEPPARTRGARATGDAPRLFRGPIPADEAHLAHPDPSRAFAGALIYPLVSPTGLLVGLIALYAADEEGFADEDLIAIAPIASLAAAAVETARLYAVSRRQIDVLRSLGGLGDSLASPAATNRALRDLGVAARRLLDASVVAIYVRDPSAWRLTMSVKGRNQISDDIIRFDVLGDLAAARDARLLSPTADRRLIDAVAPGDRTVAGGVLVPLRSGDESVGVLICVGEQRRIPDSDRELLKIISTVAAMVIQSGRVLERLASQNVELNFLEALSEGSEPFGVLTARARQLGMELDERHVAAAFQVINRGAGHSDPEEALDRLGEELLGRFPFSAVARRGLELGGAAAGARDRSHRSRRQRRGRPDREPRPARAHRRPVRRGTRRRGLRAGVCRGPRRPEHRQGDARIAARDRVRRARRRAPPLDARGIVDARSLPGVRRAVARSRRGARDAAPGDSRGLSRRAGQPREGLRSARDPPQHPAPADRPDPADQQIDLEDRTTRFELQVAVGIVRFRDVQ